MSNSRARLTPRQLRAIELMVRDGSSQRKVAAALDVSRQTVTLWTQDPRFTDALTAAA